MSDPEGSSSGVLLKRTGVFLAQEIERNLHVCLSCRCAASLARDVWLVVCAQPRECLFGYSPQFAVCGKMIQSEALQL